MTEQQKRALMVLETLCEYEDLIRSGTESPSGWAVFDNNYGTVEYLRGCYLGKQLPSPGQEFYRQLFLSVPDDQEGKKKIPSGDFEAILPHLDRFRGWLLDHYQLDKST